MPLHLLSKKSWNVYSTENRARVARDEALAEAAAKDASREQGDAESVARLEALRNGYAQLDGSTLAEPLSEQDKLVLKATEGLGEELKKGPERSRKRKRIPGEDDTARDIRYAQERATDADSAQEKAVARLRGSKPEEADAPLTDRNGHVNLFPEPRRKSDGRRDSRRSETDKAKEQQRESQEGFGMHLKDALGRRGGKDAWYLDAQGVVKDAAGRDVWGNEDPRRHARQAARVVAADPLAFMNKAQAQLKEVRRDKADRERELRRARADEDVGLESFSLDGPPSTSAAPRDGLQESRLSRNEHGRWERPKERSRRRERSRDRSHRKHRSRSRSREQHRRRSHRSRSPARRRDR